MLDDIKNAVPNALSEVKTYIKGLIAGLGLRNVDLKNETDIAKINAELARKATLVNAQAQDIIKIVNELHASEDSFNNFIKTEEAIKVATEDVATAAIGMAPAGEVIARAGAEVIPDFEATTEGSAYRDFREEKPE